jgi:hypothetical protein
VSEHDGHGAPGRRPGPGRRVPAGRPPGPTVKPAAVVFGIIAVLFVAGFVADDLTSAHHPAVARPAARPSPVAGTGGLVPEPAATVLGGILEPGEPPADVLGAVVVPRGTAAVPGSATQRGVGLYDATVDLEVPAPEGHALAFFRAELAAGRWKVLSAGPSGAGYRFVAQHPGSDGYEWELGITLSPTTFPSPSPAQPSSPQGVTPVTLRLFASSYDS